MKSTFIRGRRVVMRCASSLPLRFGITTSVDDFRRLQKTGDGIIVQTTELGKSQILIAVPGKILRQQQGCLRTQTPLRRPDAVNRAQHEVDLQRALDRTLPREGEQCLHQLVRILPMVGALGPLAHDLGIGLLPENLLPHLQISGDHGLARRIQFKPGHQQQQIGIGPEHGTRRAWSQVISAQRLVETRQAVRVGEVNLLGSGQAGERVVIRSQPAVVLRQQACHELFRRFRICSRQLLPGRFCSRPAGHDHPSIPNGNVTAVKIENGSERKQPG